MLHYPSITAQASINPIMLINIIIPLIMFIVVDSFFSLSSVTMQKRKRDIQQAIIIFVNSSIVKNFTFCANVKLTRICYTRPWLCAVPGRSNFRRIYSSPLYQYRDTLFACTSRQDHRKSQHRYFALSFSLWIYGSRQLQNGQLVFFS